MSIDEFLKQINTTYSNTKFTQLQNNKFLLEEVNIVKNMNKGIEYYTDIILNIDIDRSNPNNSYIMWIFDKVDNIDTNQPVNYKKGRTSLPDIDVDFPISKRGLVIQYIREKYGQDRVSQMATFGRLMGRGALKEVLRVHSACSFTEMNTITQAIPQESEIADQLEASGEKSIIKWTLQHMPEELKPYCQIDDNENLTGDYAHYFRQAIRLEGTYKSQGKHAAGLIISAKPLDEVCPMIHDKHSEEKIAGMDMNDLESMGHVKFDILGVALLDKLMGVNNLLKYGKVEND